jgi:hypothetical protein
MANFFTAYLLRNVEGVPSFSEIVFINAEAAEKRKFKSLIFPNPTV